MAQYSIDQFSNITGLNKILIRTWENRYSFLEPMRTNTNIRYYDDEMLTKGIKYSILIENGHKISKVVKYENTEVNNLIEEILRISKDKETINSIYISKLVESALFFDQKLFNDTYDLLTKELGVNPIMINSSLLSAQHRRRYYWTNIPNVKQPIDQNILLKDIID